jgi:hypothetical protein
VKYYSATKRVIDGEQEGGTGPAWRGRRLVAMGEGRMWGKCLGR